MASEEWSLISVFPRGCTSKVRSPLLYITKLINWGRYSIGTQTSKLPTGWGPMGEVWKWGTWESSRLGRISLVIPLHTTVMLPAATSRIIASRRAMAASSFGEILFLACHYCNSYLLSIILVPVRMEMVLLYYLMSWFDIIVVIHAFHPPMDS